LLIIFLNQIGVKMKRVLVLTFAIAVLFGSALDLSAKNYKQSISIDPLDFLISKVFNATYEHQICKENSFTVFASYYSFSDYASAFGIGGSYRWYLTDVLKDEKFPIQGLSVGPMARVSYWSYDAVWSEDANDVYIVIGGEAAYKWVFDDWVVEPILRLGIGVTDIQTSYSGWGAGVNVGYAW
jgi:hypothetical protein